MDSRPPPSSPYTVHADRLLRRVLVTCIAIELGLFLADAFITYGDAIPIRAVGDLFNLTREDSLPSLMGVIQTLLLTLTLWLIVLTERRRADAPRHTLGWLLIALFFSYVLIDDGSMLHERMGTVFELSADDGGAGIGGSLLATFPSYPWQVLFMPVFAVIGLLMLHFLYTAFADRRNFRLLLDGLLLYATAVLLDFIEGLDKEHTLNVFSTLRDLFELRQYTVDHFNKTVEETLEMFGTTLIWLAFLRHFMQTNPQLTLQFVQPAAADRAD